MTEEIKEILERSKNLKNKCSCCEQVGENVYISRYHEIQTQNLAEAVYLIDKLLDYITNLQQENERICKENLDLVIKYMKTEFREYYNLKVLKEKEVMEKVKMCSVEKLLKESEEMKAIEWLNKKRLDTSLTGIELNYLNILYYLIINLLEVKNK